MKTNMKRRLMSLVIAFLMVFTYVPAAAYATDNEVNGADAGTAAVAEGPATVLEDQIRIVDSKETASAVDGVVTIKAEGVVTGKPTANKIEIYNDSDKAVVLSFDYAAENYSAFSENESTGTITAVVNSGECMNMSITGVQKISGDTTATLTLSNFACTIVPDTSEITVTFDETIGTVTLGGTAIESDEPNSVSYADGGALVAEAKDGAEFLGWVNPESGKFYSREAAYTINPIENMTFEAVFMGDATPVCYIVGNEYVTYSFEDAMAKAETTADKLVVLKKDVTLAAGEYVIPEGVTFLVPFNAEETVYTNVPESTNEAYVQPEPYCTLTLADGADLIVNGALSISAKHYAANGGGRGAGAPTGKIGYMVTGEDSTVTVNDGGALYAYGFIVGDGSVVAKTGASVYENFQLEDFRGGEVTMNIAFHEMEKGLLPISQYYVQNIEVPLTLEQGASEFVYTSLFANNQPYGAAVQFIGGSSAMFYLKDGQAVKTYDASKDRLIFDVDGQISLSPISVEMAGQGIDSSMFDIPINSNISVNLNGGSAEISQDLALLPGAEITIAEGAVCTLAEGINVFVYDLEQWEGFVGMNNENFIPTVYSPSQKYTRTDADLEDAAIRVNGTLDASAGNIFTTASGANIYSNGNGVVKTATGVPPAHYQYVQGATEGTFKQISLLPLNLKNEDNKYVQTFETETGTYTYEDGQWMCGHEIINEEITVEATCTEEGSKTITCEMEDVQAGYGHVYAVTIPAKGHSFTEYKDNNDATCTAAGTATAKCDRCDEVDVKATEKLHHTEVVDAAVEATCTETGLTEGKHCDVCKETIVEQEVVEALGHDWEEEFTFDTAPTCTTAGIRSIHCSRCDVVKEGSEEEVNALGHAVSRETIEPTCTEMGMTTDMCTRLGCGHKETFTIDALGHSYKNVVTDPTCTEEGYTTHSCIRCDDVTVDEETAALGHNKVNAVKVDATCTETGQETGVYCDRCDEIFEGMEEIAALGHEYGEWITDTAASCTDRGSKHRECNRCDATETDVIYPLGHTQAIMEAVAPTCTETGLTEGVQCSVCKLVLVAPEEVAATGHSYKTAAKAPTCTEEGYTTYTCACGDSYTADEVAATGHKPGAAATCTTAQTCTVCKAELAAATGHSYKTAVTAPTCTKEGYTTYTCACGNSYVADKVAAKGHTAVTVAGKAATCTADGLTEGKKCSVCGAITVAQEVIPAKGHSYEAVVTAATCTAEGYTTYTCACGDSKIDDRVAATGHSYGAYVTTKKATFGKAGVQTSTCAGCQATQTKTIAAAKTPTLAATAYTFNNKAKKPAVTVKNTAGTSLAKTVTYASGRKNVGTYKVTVKLTGADYTGSKVVTFKINPAKPTNVKLTKPAKKQMKVSWKKPAKAYRNQIDGYQIRYSTNKAKISKGTVVKATGKTAVSKTIKKLKSGKKYYVQVRTYNKIGSTTYYSGWTTAKSVKVK